LVKEYGHPSNQFNIFFQKKLRGDIRSLGSPDG